MLSSSAVRLFWHFIYCIFYHLLYMQINNFFSVKMFSIHGLDANTLAGEPGSASTIHFSITLLYLNENEKVHGNLLPHVIASIQQSLKGWSLRKRTAAIWTQDFWIWNHWVITLLIIFCIFVCWHLSWCWFKHKALKNHKGKLSFDYHHHMNEQNKLKTSSSLFRMFTKKISVLIWKYLDLV